MKGGRPGGAVVTVRAFIWKPKGLQGKAVSDTADALKKHPTFADVFLCFCFIRSLCLCVFVFFNNEFCEFCAISW